MAADECRDIERLLVHHVLDILDEASRNRVLAHLASCSRCLEAFDELSADLEHLRAWKDQAPPPEAVAFVLSEAAALLPAPPADDGADAPAPDSLLEGGEQSLEELEQSLADLESLIQTSKTDAPARPAAPRRPGSLSEEDRESIRKELGLDELFEDDEPGADEDEPQGEFGEFEKMARAAEEAAASRRMRRRTEDDWTRMCGTTIVGADEVEKAAQEKETGDTGEWAAKARTQPVPAPSRPVDESSFMGTTILPAAGTAPKNPTKRFSSVILASIKTEAPEKRERRKKMKKVARVSPAVAVSVGLHVALLLGLAIWVYTRIEPEPQKVLITQKADVVDEIEDDIQEEEEVDVEEIKDIFEDPDPSEKTDTSDNPDTRPTTDPIGIVSDAAPPTPVHRNDDLLEMRAGGAGGGGGGTYAAVDRALAWFSRHQDDDGKWHYLDYTAHCRKHAGGPCPHGVREIFAKERRHFTPGITGLVLLCFLGSGYTHTGIPEDRKVGDRYRRRHASYRPVVRDALGYLLRIQTADGCFGPKADLDAEGYMYNHGIDTLAVFEAYHLTGDEKLLEAGRKALSFLYQAQNQRTGGWDYVAWRSLDPEHDRSDTSVSSWQVMAMKAALDAGVEVDGACWNKARRFFMRMHRSEGRFRYARGRQADQEHVARNSQGVNAASLLSLMYLLERPLQSRILRSGASHLLLDLPNPDRLTDKPGESEEFNFHSVYYWYYGTLVMYNMGGEYWRSWKEHLTRMLKNTQETEPPLKGTWTPTGDFLGTFAGRLYVTAFNVLNLEVDYRYLPMYKKIDREASGSPGDEPEKRKLTRGQLVTVLRDRKDRYSARVRALAMEELADRFGADEKVLALLDHYLRSREFSRKTKERTVQKLSRRYGRNPAALAVLAHAMVNPDLSWTAKNTCVRTLKAAGKDALPYVRNLLLQVDDEMKKLMILILREQKDRASAKALETIAETGRTASLRRAAREALAVIGR